MSAPLYLTWPEQELLAMENQKVNFKWDMLQEELIGFRERVRAGSQEWPMATRSVHGNTFGAFREPTVDEMTLTNMGVYAAVPSVQEFVLELRRRMTVLGYSHQRAIQQESQILHQTFHLSNWKASGKKVYYLDDTTYQLLAHTPLPKLPMEVLTSPVNSFYLVLPPSAFCFGVVEDPKPQRCEGVMVTIDNIGPDARTREVAIYATGESRKDHENANVAYFIAGMGTGAKLNELTFGGGKHYGTLDPQDYLKVTVPRIVFGMLLYLASEHPDIEPVPPVKRETFTTIKSPKQRAAALKNQDDRLKKFSRLGYLHVGKHVGEEARKAAPSTSGVWKLDHLSYTSGHWKMQAYGPNHMHRKSIWIQPFCRGKIFGESPVKLRKIQTAQEA